MDTQDTGNAGLHAVLTAAGFLPVIGGLADLADAVVYLFEGDVAGAIGSGIAIFAGGIALGYKGIKGANAARKAAKAAKAAAKVDNLTDTAKIARTTTEAISNSSSFMKASNNAADLSQTVKAAKQSSVVDVMKESVTGKGGRALADQATDPYALLKQRGIPQTLTDAEINAAKKFDLRMSAYQGGNLQGKYQKASLWERLFKRSANVNDLHANPLDDFSNPRIGPSESAVAKYIKEICTTGEISNPILVQKLSTGGYEIVNGHHRWLAAQKVGLKK